MLGGALLNPDSYMRLVRLQDSLAQHALVDRVLRDGTVIHWSPLLDSALLLLAAPSCSIRHIAPLLVPYAGKVVLADANDTPELLYRTRVLTVGSLYHENVAAFRRLRAAWRSLPGDAEPAAVEATGAALVLFCPHTARSPLVADLLPETLWDRLNRGAPPRWLTEVGRDARSGNVLYRIGGTTAAAAPR